MRVFDLGRQVSVGAGSLDLRAQLRDDGLQRVLAIELMTAARGIQMRGEAPSPVSARVIERLRADVPGAGPDRYLAPDIEAAVQLVMDGELLRASGLSRPPAAVSTPSEES